MSNVKNTHPYNESSNIVTWDLRALLHACCVTFVIGLGDSGIFSIHDSLGYTTHNYEYYHDTSREV